MFFPKITKKMKTLWKNYLPVDVTDGRSWIGESLPFRSRQSIFLEKCFCKFFVPFQFCSLFAGSKTGDLIGEKKIAKPGGQVDFWPDDDQIDVLLLTPFLERRKCTRILQIFSEWTILDFACIRWCSVSVSRNNEDFRHWWRMCQFPCNCRFSSSRPQQRNGLPTFCHALLEGKGREENLKNSGLANATINFVRCALHQEQVAKSNCALLFKVRSSDKKVLIGIEIKVSWKDYQRGTCRRSTN